MREKQNKKKPRRAVYQFHVVCFDGNGCAWVGFSPEKKIQIPLCQEMALSDWNYKLIKKPEKSDGFQIVYWKWY